MNGEENIAVVLSDSEIGSMLHALEGWKILNGKLHKEFEFDDFEDAISFINKVATIAESLYHHPEIWNSYNRVVIDLITHDEEGITDLDFAFAKHVDSLRTRELK